MNFLQWLAIIILALIPILAWSYTFLAKSNESRQLMMKVFFWGGVSTVPLLFYRWLWNFFPSFNFIETLTELTAGKYFTLGTVLVIPISYILIFMTIGILEEYLKALIVRRKVPKKEINFVSDAVEFSIVAGLGFAFIENIFYLGEIYAVVGSSALIKMFISRALFATFAHALFSGIFGYYYGISMFAKKNMAGHKDSLNVRMIKKLKEKFPRLNKISFFKAEETLVGLFYAAGLHAIYNIFLELKFTLFLIPFLVFGFIFLNRLLKVHKQVVE